MPSDSVDKGKDLFFRWLKSKGVEIHARSVEVILRNDQFNPSTAVAVCKEMVEKEHVFMLFGFQGPDQMQACARYAASRNVPYAFRCPRHASVESLVRREQMAYRTLVRPQLLASRATPGVARIMHLGHVSG